ncbi:MAG: hypothetical protein P4L16_02070 [Chlamydiales bacterium]|nr:hypothetical protein [Chlamydiales bacterium]
MPDLTAPKKNKINLADYPYKRDVENRLLMADFSAFDIELLREIVDGPLSISLTNLVDALEVDETQIVNSLKKLERSGLLKKSFDCIIVDKDTRKYYETQLIKFDPDFQPGIEYIKSLLKKVPIEHIPVWYALPRTSDDIFQAIIEKYLLTPRIFKRHIAELTQELPIVKSIINDLEMAEKHQLPSCYFHEKYSYKKEEFEELMLFLEFNFICCINYVSLQDRWIEVVTPFAEWKEHLSFSKKIKNKKESSFEKEISPFGFIKKLQQTLVSIKNKPTLIDELESTLLKRLQELQLVELQDLQVTPLERANSFLSLRDDQQAHCLYRLPLHIHDYASSFCQEKHLRELEKQMAMFAKHGWISFHTFLEGCTAGIGTQSELMLKKTGKQWCYMRPCYLKEEEDFIKKIIFEKFFEAGLVDTTYFQDKEYFCVTPFGHKLLT